MRFNIKDYEKAFPRQAEPVRVKFEPDEKVDSVIEGSSEDPEGPAASSQEPEKGIKIYRGPEQPEAEAETEGGDLIGGSE